MNQTNKIFAIFGNTFQAEKSAHIVSVFNAITRIGGQITIERVFAEFLSRVIDLAAWPHQVFASEEVVADFAISIGGDGTFLKTAQQIGDRQIPIIGVNTGHLGFISDLMPSDADAMFERIANNEFVVEERSLLVARSNSCNLVDNPYALNEIAILKHHNSSMISITTYVNDKFLTTYQADGLIVSTPTGSTGYSLSVGGPILSPDSKSIILSPIAAHSLAVRPFILNDNVVVRMTVKSRSNNFMVAIDGRSHAYPNNTEIEISTAPYNIRIIRSKDYSFFDTLRNKLLWGAGGR